MDSGNEFIAALRAMPSWAQIGLGWFVLTFLAMLLAPTVSYRRHWRRIERLAADFGTTAQRGSEAWPVGFSATVDGRAFEVQYDHRSRSTRLSVLPTGDLLVTRTALTPVAWSLHEVDIVPGRPPGWLIRLLPSVRRAGLGADDAPFQQRSHGEPVRPGWFDADCRAAVTAFYELSPEPGPMQVSEGVLVHRSSEPWPVRDGEALRELLRRQAAVARAFEGRARRE